MVNRGPLNTHKCSIPSCSGCICRPWWGPWLVGVRAVRNSRRDPGLPHVRVTSCHRARSPNQQQSTTGAESVTNIYTWGDAEWPARRVGSGRRRRITTMQPQIRPRMCRAARTPVPTPVCATAPRSPILYIHLSIIVTTTTLENLAVWALRVCERDGFATMPADGFRTPRRKHTGFYLRVAWKKRLRWSHGFDDAQKLSTTRKIANI